ncbi:hypothetical protein [Marinospirillum sp.]|uniref:hypothetical protein n=1 Tax=Marinospirillum sp. TaxID=2183934 RepID=UPI00384FBC9F
MQTNLKTLSRQYANGLLTKTDYRQARAELIETAQDNDHTEPQVTVPQSATEEDDQDSESSDKEGWQSNSPRPPPPEANREPSKQCKRRNQFLLVLVLLLAAALGYLTLA